MSSTADGEKLMELEVIIDGEPTARDFAQWLRSNQAQGISARAGAGIDPLITPIVVTAVLATRMLARTIIWMKQRTACQLIVDAREYPKIRKQLDCRIRDGRVILLAGANDRVELLELPPADDLQGVLQSIISGMGDTA